MDPLIIRVDCTPWFSKCCRRPDHADPRQATAPDQARRPLRGFARSGRHFGAEKPVRNPDLSKSPRARRAPARSASNNIKRTGTGTAVSGVATGKHRRARPNGTARRALQLPYSPPASISSRKTKNGKIFLANQAGSPDGQRSGRSHARIQMRSQDVSYYNPGAPLGRLRAGPFSPSTPRLWPRCHQFVSNRGWGGIYRVGHPPHALPTPSEGA